MFKDKLKDNRMRLGLSQEDLAKKLFVSRSAVAKWEQGRGFPEDESLENLAKLFGLSTDELLSKEDMKNEIKTTEGLLAKNKRKSLIGLILSTAVIGALAITLISGAFVYRPSGESVIESHAVTSVTEDEGKIASLVLENKTSLSRSQWFDAECYDEFSRKQSSLADLHLREGDEMEIRYPADKNLFGRRRIGSSGISKISLKSHLFDAKQALFGLGFSFKDSESFSSSDPGACYFRLYEEDPSLDDPMVIAASQNIYRSEVAAMPFDVSLTVAFDRAVLTSGTIHFFYNDFANAWKDTYFDMEEGAELNQPGSSLASILSLSFSILGGLPSGSRIPNYVDVCYNVTVFSKANPSRYEIKSYDSSDVLLGTSKVLPDSDLSALSLPSNRSYSRVEEYEGDALSSASEKILKGEEYSLCFSSAYGLFDGATSRVRL